MARRTRVLGGTVVLFTLFGLGNAAAKAGPQDLPEPGKDYDWKKVAKAHGLADADIAALEKNKVLMTNQAFKQVFTSYIESDLPLFITADSLLNAFHVLYEESILRLETANAAKLPRILQFVWKNLGDVEKNFPGNDKLSAAAKRRAQIVVGIAMTLLGEPDLKANKEVAGIIDEEVMKIIAAEGLAKPTWLGRPDDAFLAIDYSRYRPRGFYTKSATLQRYFRAVSWLQSIPFRVGNDEEFLAILMLGNTVNFNRFEMFDAAGNARQREIRAFFQGYREFVGAGDDLDLMTAAQESQNAVRLDEKAEGFGGVRKSLAESLDREAYDHEAPQINDQIRFAPDDPKVTAEPNLRILSAYRTPDAALFQRTTDLRQFPNRQFPTGLEVCTALGSPFARGRLVGVEKGRVLATIDANKKLFAGRGLYCQYLDCLAALLDKPEPDAPAFMSSPAWQIKSCQTVLSGWAQLRHTWVLQAKLTVEFFGGTETVPGFVEPTPEFFARLGGLAESTQARLWSAGAFGVPRAVFEAALAKDIREGLQLLKSGKLDLQKLPPAESGKFETMMMLLANGSTTRPDKEAPVEDPLQRLTKAIPQFEKLADDLEKGKADLTPGQLRVIKETQPDLLPLWEELEDTCIRLESLANKQLRGRPLSEREKHFVLDYGRRIAGVMLYGGNSYLTPLDDGPRIVDVVSNPQAGKFLEVGVCRPRALYVLYPYKGGEVLCRGAVMPYYEFVHPARLTDAEWKTMLDSKDRPAGPEWVQPIVGEGELAVPMLKKE